MASATARSSYVAFLGTRAGRAPFVALIEAFDIADLQMPTCAGIGQRRF